MRGVYSVLLVDDEPRALSGIRRTFPWEPHGFRVALETTDPAEALRALRRGGFDLAFVDIRMPEMSGLELIRAARTEGLRTEFVLVSGYAEFEFARDALRQGVLDYCLKPIKAEAAEDILRKAAERLRVTAHGRTEPLPADVEGDPQSLAGRFPDPLPFFQAVVATTDGGNDAPPAVLDGLPPGTRSFRAASGREALFVLNLEADLREVPLPAAVLACGTRAGIGGPYRDLADLAESIGQARRALLDAFIHPGRSWFAFKPPRTECTEEIVGSLLAKVAEGDLGGLEAACACLPAKVRERDLSMGDLDHLYGRIAAAMSAPGGGAGDPPRPAIRNAFRGLEDFCAGLARLCADDGAATGFRAFHNARGNARVTAILSHIHAHLGEELSLRRIAAEFHVHPSYGSALFKNVAGVSFSEYVTRARIQRSVSLLRDTALTIGEVAEAVGYDYYHFIKTFTRRTGSSPSQFRHAGGIRREPGR